MTEIAEYLKKTLEKRREIVKTAEQYIKRSSLKPAENENHEENPSVLGPTVQKFKEFESNLNDRLKKIFNPAYDSSPSKNHNCAKSKEFLIRVYSNNFVETDKKKSIGLGHRPKSKDVNRLAMYQHHKNNSFDIKCLFIPVLINSPHRRSRIASRNS